MKKSSKDWYAEIPSELGFVIYDPDGWDRSNYEFSFNQELITKEEFVKRVFESTVLTNQTANEFFEKWQKETQIIRVIDFDGMGGKEYEYHCGGCKAEVKTSDNFCRFCGSKLNGIFIQDTWGI